MKNYYEVDMHSKENFNFDYENFKNERLKIFYD